MATIKTTEEKFNGTGSQTVFPFTIEYLLTSDLQVFVSNILQTETTHYSISGTNLTFVTAPASGTGNVRIARSTGIDKAQAVYATGSSVRARDLNANQDQFLFKLQERENVINAQASSTAPKSPVNGDRWYDTTSGRTYVYYEEANSSQWVEASPAHLNTSSPQITSISNAQVVANAAIAQSKLNLAITDNEIASTLSPTKVSFTQTGTGAVARTADSKLKEIVSVKDFGATGNGTTDDTTAIQTAVTYLNLLALTQPVTLHFPAGTYRITAPINFSLNAASGRPMREIVGGDGAGYAAKILIQYNGYGSSLVSGNDKGAFYFGPEVDGATNNQAAFSIYGFEFVGDSTTYQHAPAIECKGAAQSFISNIKISYINNAAISLDSPQNNKIMNVISYFCGRSFAYKDRGTVTVTQGALSTPLNTLTASSASFFENSDIGKNIALWGPNAARRKTKIISVSTDGQTATVEDAASSPIEAAQNILFGSPHITSLSNSTTITADASTFDTSHVGAHVWFKITGPTGSNSLLRRKITSVTVPTGQTSTNTATIDSPLGKVVGKPFSGTYNQSNDETVTVTATNHGLLVGDNVTLDYTTGSAVDGDFTVATVADANTFTVEAASVATNSGNVTIEPGLCEIAIPSLEIFSDHAAGNSSDNKFTNIQIEAHYGVGICAEDQSVLDFIHTKIHAEQGTLSDLDAVDKYSSACMWLMQVDGSYLGKFEGQYIGRNKLWITSQTSAFTLVNLVVGSADFERIIGIEKKNTFFDGAALVICGLQVNHAFPTHNISNMIEDANLAASGSPTGYIMNGPFINQGSQVSRKLEGYVTQNAYVEESGTTTKAPKLHLKGSAKEYSITPSGGSGLNQLEITNETDSEKIILSLAAGNFIYICNSAGVPSTDPNNGGYLYVQSGALKYRGSGGTVTTLGNA